MDLPNMRAIFWFNTFFSSVNLFCSRNFLVLSSTAADATLVSFGVFCVSSDSFSSDSFSSDSFSSDSFSSDSFSSSSSLKRRKVYLKMYNSVIECVKSIKYVYWVKKKTWFGLCLKGVTSIEDIQSRNQVIKITMTITTVLSIYAIAPLSFAFTYLLPFGSRWK